MAHIGMWDRRGGWSLDSPFDLFLISFLVLCTWRRPIESFDSDSLGNTCIWGFRDIISRLREFSSITYSLHSSNLTFSTAFFSVAFHPFSSASGNKGQNDSLVQRGWVQRLKSDLLSYRSKTTKVSKDMPLQNVRRTKKFIFPNTKSLAKLTYQIIQKRDEYAT